MSTGNGPTARQRHIFVKCTGAVRSGLEIDGNPVDIPVPAETYRVELFGRGAAGDAAWAFELITRVAGTAPPLYAEVFRYPGGPDLDPASPLAAVVGNVPRPPEIVAAALTVVAGDGPEGTDGLIPVPTDGCWEGVRGLRRGSFTDDEHRRPGTPPYQLTLTATIDGSSTESASLVWPDDFPDSSYKPSRVEATTQ